MEVGIIATNQKKTQNKQHRQWFTFCLRLVVITVHEKYNRHQEMASFCSDMLFTMVRTVNWYGQTNVDDRGSTRKMTSLI